MPMTVTVNRDRDCELGEWSVHTLFQISWGSASVPLPGQPCPSRVGVVDSHGCEVARCDDGEARVVGTLRLHRRTRRPVQAARLAFFLGRPTTADASDWEAGQTSRRVAKYHFRVAGEHTQLRTCWEEALDRCERDVEASLSRRGKTGRGEFQWTLL